MTKNVEQPKVITLKSNNVKMLEQLQEMEKEGKIKNFIFAANLTDGTIATAIASANTVDMLTLISYLQVHTTRRIMSDNQEGE